MIDDLKIIKKKYGERMSHLCRTLFPTLLEQQGYLSNLLLEHFEPDRSLYEDIMQNNLVPLFQEYILSFNSKERTRKKVTKTPKELLSEVGYDLYECKTEDDIRAFRKYFAPGEELCTFEGGRLERCHVFFAVKRGAEKLNRKDFKNPCRQDEYGTSVISIQFSKGNKNTISIKNRYNHSVANPDATFSNNLDAITPGLTDSFEQTYGYDLSLNTRGFEIPGYVNVDGKFYKYNYEQDNIYYCTNNIIIDNFKVIRDYQQMERYIVFDYFILDLKEKTLLPYCNKYGEYMFRDLFTRFFCEHEQFEVQGVKTHIKDIKVEKSKITGNKTIYIYVNDGEPVEIEINKANQMIKYKNNNLKKLDWGVLKYNRYLQELELRNALEIEGYNLIFNNSLTKLVVPFVQKIGIDFLSDNTVLRKVILPKKCYISHRAFASLMYHIRRNNFNIPNFVVINEKHYTSTILKNKITQFSNWLMNKREIDLSNDEIKITKVKKSGALNKLIEYILHTPEPEKAKEEEKGKTK